MAQNDRADRARDVADAEAQQCEQRSRRRIEVDEEHAREDQGRGGAVDEEVVVFEHAADEADDGRAVLQAILVQCPEAHVPPMSIS